MRAVYFSSLFGASYALTIGQTVQTSSGSVEGHAATVNENVSTYLGIPYAQAPVGNLRFMPPVKYNGNATIKGTKIGDACPAVTFFSARANNINNYNTSLANITAQGTAFISQLEQVNASFSEDCLKLNVWVPTGGESKKSVMIYIYGGSYTSGSTQIPLYDGQHLAAEQEVIVVSFNYRLDILGFHGAPGSTNQNPGFLDQRLAVEWVRDNIAAFGGDTTKMILFGQSAGAASVDSYGYSWASDPIVSGMIMESGAAGFGEALPADNGEGWYSVSGTVGCGTNTTNTSAEVFSCMQTKDVWDVLNAMGDYTFNPTADNITGFPDYPALSRAGKFAQLPIVTGNNNFEAGIYILVYALDNATYDYNHWEAHDNATFGCPAGARANVSASHNLPTWRYRWFGNFPNTRLFTNPDSGAYHCSEIPFIWDTLPTGPGIPPDTEEEIAIRAYIQGAWGAFAKDPVSGLTTYGGGWPQYSPSEPTLIRLAYNNLTGTNVALPEIYDATCLTTYPIDDTDSYPASNSTASSSSTASATPSASAAKSVHSASGAVALSVHSEVLPGVLLGLGIWTFLI